MRSPIFYDELPTSIGRLGALVRDYHTDEAARRKERNFGLFWAGFGGLILVTGIAFTLILIDRIGPANRFWAVVYALTPTTGIGLYIAIRALPFLLSAYRSRRTALGIYERGFAILRNKALHVFRWTDVEGIRTRIERHYTRKERIRTTHAYRISHKDGTSIVLKDQLPDIVEIVAIIKEDVYPKLFKSLIRKLKRREIVYFGPLELNNHGIVLKRKFFRWEKVKVTMASNGDLEIREEGGGILKKAAIEASEIPNLELLLKYLNRLIIISYKDTPCQ